MAIGHKDKVETLACRLGRPNEKPENHWGRWLLPDLVSWNGYPSTALRDRLSAHGRGAATFALKDSAFPGDLEKAHKYKIQPPRSAPIHLDLPFDFDVDKHELPSGMPDPNTPPDDDDDEEREEERKGAEELKKRDLRVMPLGDSITYGIGSSTESSYRADLWNKLDGKTKSIDFVGSMRSGRLPDPDNEGHSGAMISQIAHAADTAVPLWRPNVVLVHAGTCTRTTTDTARWPTPSTRPCSGRRPRAGSATHPARRCAATPRTAGPRAGRSPPASRTARTNGSPSPTSTVTGGTTTWWSTPGRRPCAPG
ncbi:hypothetical protein [Spongiactinospora gelatinilytica]|uniref:hypothetical protein n=1 Tax=Spongiactinospora gelatinilytica TaxID=2666298 RepID=UPI0018F2ADD3|nr:hypothetical protein [Spongiactinospora gelatinilytica]